jgi:hypothetical protein
MAEKRRKLKETWDRVISMYEKDAPEQWEDLKKLWMNYQVFFSFPPIRYWRFSIPDVT